MFGESVKWLARETYRQHVSAECFTSSKPVSASQFNPEHPMSSSSPSCDSTESFWVNTNPHLLSRKQLEVRLGQLGPKTVESVA